MAIKLRSFSTNTAVKIICFVLAVVFITVTLAQLQLMAFKRMNFEPLFIQKYKDSEEFVSSYVRHAAYKVDAMIAGKEPGKQEEAFYYYISDGEKEYANTSNTNKSFFAQYDDAFYAFENGTWTTGENTNSEIVPMLYYGPDSKHTIYIAFPDSFFNMKQTEWESSRNDLMPMVVTTIIYATLALALIIFLLCVTGKKPQDKELHLSEFDKIYSDILFLGFIPPAALWLMIVSNITFRGGNVRNILSTREIYSMILFGVLNIIVASVCGLILLSLARKAKAGILLKNSFCYKLWEITKGFFKNLFDGSMFNDFPLTKTLFYRQLIFIVVSGFLAFFTFILLLAGTMLLLLPPLLEIIVIYWYVKTNNKTYQDINKGFDEGLQQRMQAERMKVELVTNVSHDLKTPLTSIISYVELLSKEENLSETANDYLRILIDKSNRLKQIVSDLFDLAKSTSGNIALDLEALDIKKLIEQTIADMEDRIAQSELRMKIKLPDNPMYIMADGKKLYRVFQNVIDNALKYSLKGTRVFVELVEDDGRAIATIKNTAGYEMDFTAQEILQRFNRGDKSRSTEGSGLGLSIADSFTNVCGGAFKVDVDGDLFKVTISFDII